MNMQQGPSSFTRRVLDIPPAVVWLEVDLALSRTAPVPEIEGEPDRLFLATVRENLYAAALHAALGHTGPSFRECDTPACIEAAKLIPELDPLRRAATDDELDAILDDVLTSLEREGTSFFALKPS
jgi:hypothetical protein